MSFSPLKNMEIPTYTLSISMAVFRNDYVKPLFFFARSNDVLLMGNIHSYRASHDEKEASHVKRFAYIRTKMDDGSLNDIS